MRILIMAGGTGGHVFPALAVYNALSSEGCEVMWLGTRGRLEEKIVPQSGCPISYISARGIRGSSFISKLKIPLMLTRSLFEAAAVIKKFKPDAVLGMGGYASGPGGVAARLLGIPLCLHEQNAAAGLTNRILAKMAAKILLGFKGAFTGSKVIVCGNPVRAEILSLYNREHNFLPDGVLRILVVGGSLGAKFFNDNLPLYFKALDKASKIPFRVRHQCGSGNAAAVNRLYEGADFEYVAEDFILDMKTAYEHSDLIICRSGALTAAEVSCAGVPAVFIPYPYAVDDHQTKNAKVLEEAGGAFMAAQQDLDKDLFIELVLKAGDPETLRKMSRALHDCACPEATAAVVKVLHELAGR